MATPERYVRPGQRSRAGRRQLGLFDATCLVVGAVVGADIYVVTGQGAGLLGPAALVAWLVAGAMALAIALAFAQCALVLPQAGGSFAYTRVALGPLPGFLVGWCLYLAELVGVAVFPLAFTRYLGALVPGLTGGWELAARAAFVAFITATNVVGVRTAGTVNDALTVAKLLPLGLLVLLWIPWTLAHPATAAAHLSPFAPLGWGSFGPALVLAFWAYAGFEVVPLPADEVRAPSRTLPLALGRGMLVATTLYLLVNAVTLTALPWAALAGSTTPLVTTASALFQGLGLPGVAAVVLMAVGAMLSIGGVDEALTLGTPRLAYGLAAAGYLPRWLAYRSRRFGTPAAAILFQGLVTLALSGLGSLAGLIALSVFYLGLVYAATALAAWRFATWHPEHHLAVPLAGLVPPLALASSLLLVAASALPAGPGAALGLLAGVPFYLRASRGQTMRRTTWREIRAESRREIDLIRHRFLANVLWRAGRLVSRLR